MRVVTFDPMINVGHNDLFRGPVILKSVSWMNMSYYGIMSSYDAIINVGQQ